MLKSFIAEYGTTIIYAIITGIAGYIGIIIKKLCEKYINTKTKKDVVKTCVEAVEQLYKELHGEDKYNKVVESVVEMLAQQNITVTELELKMLIEAAVGEFNKVFENNTITPDSSKSVEDVEILNASDHIPDISV